MELLAKYFKEFSTSNTEKMQIFEDMVSIVGKKAAAAKDAIYIRDRHK